MKPQKQRPSVSAHRGPTAQSKSSSPKDTTADTATLEAVQMVDAEGRITAFAMYAGANGRRPNGLISPSLNTYYGDSSYLHQFFFRAPIEANDPDFAALLTEARADGYCVVDPSETLPPPICVEEDKRRTRKFTVAQLRTGLERAKARPKTNGEAKVAAAENAPSGGVPRPMHEARRWLLWRLERKARNKKPTKVPYYASGGRRSGTMDTPADVQRLASFDEALAAFDASQATPMPYTGLGYALGRGIGGADLDGVRDPATGVIKPWAQAIIDSAQTYTEVSPSGCGVHLLGYANGEAALAPNDTGVEFYASDRFFTMTFDPLKLVGLAALAPIYPALAARHGAKNGEAKTDAPENGEAKASSGVPLLWPDARLTLDACLPKIDATSRDTWLRVGMVIHHESGGSETGYEVWCAWSRPCNKYDPDDQRRVWASFGKRKGKPLTLGTLVMMARQADEPPTVAPSTSKPDFTAPDAPELPAWPQPRSGVMQQSVQWMLDSAVKPQPELALLATVCAFGAACGSEHHLPDGMRLNLYGVGMVQTGEGKDNPRSCAVQIATAAKVRVIGHAASGEGLEDELEDRCSVFQPLDEVAHIIEAMEGGGKPPHLINLNKSYLALFSASKSEYHRRSKSGKKSERFANPALSLLGFSTPSKTGTALQVSGVVGGMANRIIWAMGREDVKPRLLDGEMPMPKTVRERLERIGERRVTLAVQAAVGKQRPFLVRYADGLRLRMQALLEEFDRSAKEGGEEYRRALLGRSQEKMLRVAGAVAVIESPEAPLITPEILEWAAQFIRASDATLLAFMDRYGATGEQQVFAKQIEAACNDLFMLLAKTEGKIKGKLTERVRGWNTGEQAALEMGMIPVRQVMRATHLDTEQIAQGMKYLTAMETLRELNFQRVEGKRGMRVLERMKEDD